MSQSFSTDLVPISDRLEAWLWNAKPTCGDCRFHFPRRLPFHGSIERRTLAGIDLTRFASTPLSFAKFPVVAGDSEERGCIVITQLEGMRQYCQSGAMALLTAGDTTLIDSGRPWTSDCSGDCSRLYLRIPRWFVQERADLGNATAAANFWTSWAGSDAVSLGHVFIRASRGDESRRRRGRH